jgi:predicted RNase H-like HicB family nuclease
MQSTGQIREPQVRLKAKTLRMDSPYYTIRKDGNSPIGATAMKTTMTMAYWKGQKYWVGKLLEHPEIMTQGRALKELEENMKDAYRLMAMDDVPKQHRVKKIAV